MIKRIFDIVISVVALILLSPLLLALAVTVRWQLGAPVFFVQTRPGLHGRPFLMIKFRTMTDVRDATGVLLPNDQRLLSFGRRMRELSLDELPELWNVLVGDMSIVGPRPLKMEYLDRYTSVQRRRHEVRPGVTGWAQINGRNATDWETRLKMDVWYVDNRSFWLDLRIIVRTILNVLKRKDVRPPNSDFMPPFRGKDR